MEKKRGAGGDGGNRWRNKEGNCSGMEATSVVITFHTNCHRASGNELLMVSLEVKIYILMVMF